MEFAVQRAARSGGIRGLVILAMGVALVGCDRKEGDKPAETTKTVTTRTVTTTTTINPNASPDADVKYGLLKPEANPKDPKSTLVEFYRRVLAGDADGAFDLSTSPVAGDRHRRVIAAMAKVGPIRAKFIAAVHARFGRDVSANPLPGEITEGLDYIAFFNPDLQMLVQSEVRMDGEHGANFYPYNARAGGEPWIRAIENGKWRINIPLEMTNAVDRVEAAAAAIAARGPAATAEVAAGKYDGALAALQSWHGK